MKLDSSAKISASQVPSDRSDVDRAAELRCSCNRLLARMAANSIVLKCPRCKRQAVLSLDPRSQPAEFEVRFTE